MNRYVCVHGHFYQPPRENPTIEAVELQDSAYPYHDWNDRITAECYGPNGASRILDGDGRIMRIVNNYAKISFNFGPTLLTWLEDNSPDVYHSILAADRESQERFSGHGSAMAQAYNHMILPLANERDKRTQVIWGIRDFEHRFGRRPEGMWLPETAVDVASLEALAEQGIKFTVLAPYQAGRIRRTGSRTWRDVSGGRVDPKRTYEQRLPSGRKIALFFYDGPTSRAVAFENLLERGEYLAGRLAAAFTASPADSELVHFATDGETYGHHRRHGDMALAYALDYLEGNDLARLTNYGEFLALHPPTCEVDVVGNTSWSCFHGVERWRGNCGCSSGGHDGWNQEWRGPLRAALDWLRDTIAPRYEQLGSRLFRDPWVTRDDYISVVLDRSDESIARFFAEHAVRDLDDADRVLALKLLEMQRHAMLMYTSCGWFFDEISGIETVQVIQYAGRVVHLAEDVFGEPIEESFLSRLEHARSNIAEHRDGRHIYEKWVRPSLIDLDRAGVHYAISSLFEDFGERTRVYSYTFERDDYRPLSTGKVKLALGRVRVTSDVTRETKALCYGALHLGDHNLSAGVRDSESLDAGWFESVWTAARDAFSRADLTELLRVVDRAFGSDANWLSLLFKDEQRHVLNTILGSTLRDTEAVYRQVYDHNAPMMRFLSDLATPLPKAWQAAAELTINAGLRRSFESDDISHVHVAALLDEARRWQIALDRDGLAYVLRGTLERMMERLKATPDDLGLLQRLEDAISLARSLPFEVDLWRTQNVYYELLQTVYREVSASGSKRDGARPGGNGNGSGARTRTALVRPLGGRTTDEARIGPERLPVAASAGSTPSLGGRVTAPGSYAVTLDGEAGNGRTAIAQLVETRTEDWVTHFLSLGEKLGVRVQEVRDELIGRAPAVLSAAEELSAERRMLRATYRLQFGDDLSFSRARELVSYLDALGVSECYASPIFKARTGSTHGYDVCDHTRLNPRLGSERDFDALARELRSRGMGLILDFVPNHMGIGDPANVWWMDVLENGPSSIYARYFDIDWHRVKPELQNKVLLPILEDQYGKVLESGKFRLAYEPPAFYIYHYDTKLPVAPCSYSRILGFQLEQLARALGEDHENVREMRSILTALSYLPARNETSPAKIAERNREKEIIKARIASLYASSAYVRAAIDTSVEVFNGNSQDLHSFDMLHELLEAQAYRPAYWRVAAEEINYRRFFEVNELVAIRVELPEVFAATHELLLQMLADGKVTGVRIDHPDGLWDPGAYFDQLQRSALRSRVLARLGLEYADDDVERALSTWFAARAADRAKSTPPPLYVVAEKILSEGETLPSDWAVDGTTGYDFLNLVNGLFVDGANRRSFDRIYSQFTGEEMDYRTIAHSAKKMIMLVSLASEVHTLAHHLERISEKNRRVRDFTLNGLTFALREIIAALPIYRTYISGPGTVGPEDRSYVEMAVAEAKRRNPRTAASLFDFIRDALLLQNLEDFEEEDRRTLSELVMRVQQVTGPVMAKGVEDTAFYVYNRLVSLNEVGGHPNDFGVSVAQFHRANEERLRKWPHSMLSTSTHDTKRSEDVRARIDVLSELPEEWRNALSRWSRINASKKTVVGSDPLPDRNDEYLLYQALLGTWPDAEMSPAELATYRERIASFLLKAVKEAKRHTSWINANEAYDSAVDRFVRKLLRADAEDAFLASFRPFQARVSYFGKLNSLSQLLLKLTSPGVPDVYQGTELWDYSLVDPDNRRPVDFARRRELLAELEKRLQAAGPDRVALARELLETMADGRIKLYLLTRALDHRRQRGRLYSDGGYVPLSALGELEDHVCAFARTLGDDAALAIAPRLVVGLTNGEERPPVGGDVWKETWLALPDGLSGHRYRDVFTGRSLEVGARDGTPGLSLAELLSAFPVALLERVAD